ncbi:hypothetical protein LTR62_000851 [Meristemomyces frigidus]|uniref:Protein kinase domain-containing protein n=1 Tax=Meristemomyces frigidus TaxID=1508187 RepID=A0AAN7TL45_9PEZI|nr:hypothetical protein LTR62_000851 [Meristemomyces frigidus]
MQRDHQVNQLEVLATLQRLLKKANHKIEGLTKRSNDVNAIGRRKVKVKRWKYVWVKPFLDTTIRDFRVWQRLYDPSWFLILRSGDPMVDQELRKPDPGWTSEGAAVMHRAARVGTAVSSSPPSLTGSQPSTTPPVFLPHERPATAETSATPFSSASVARIPGQNNLVIIDPIPCPPGTYIGTLSQDIRNLASKLQVVDPLNFGILKCRGVVKQSTNNGARLASFDVVFEFATPGQPCSLRSRLLSSTVYSLTDRIQLAKQLATAVSYVHTLNFVHKNIRLENLIGFENEADTALLPFYLIGFEQLRTVDGHTYMRGDNDWWRNLCRHPDRQGPVPEERYNIGHDTYSLGVCLLEIGLWQSFVQYDAKGVVDSTGEELGPRAREFQRARPHALKDHLVELARRRLPQAMGIVYAGVVHECLTCLDNDEDDDSEDPAGAVPEADAVSMGVRYHEQVSN